MLLPFNIFLETKDDLYSGIFYSTYLLNINHKNIWFDFFFHHFIYNFKNTYEGVLASISNLVEIDK